MTNQNDFRSKYGPWAVVAGASEGIGAAFAGHLAARGLNLVLVARRGEMLAELGAKLAADYLTQIRPLAIDLADAGGPAAVAEQTADLEIGLLPAEGLWDELRAQGIDVLACCAGATATADFTDLHLHCK